MPGRGRSTIVLNLLTCHVHDLAWYPSIRYGHGYPLFLRLGVGRIALTVAPAVARDFGYQRAGHAPAVEPPQSVLLARVEAGGDLRGDHRLDLIEGGRAVHVIKDAVAKERSIPEFRS